MKSTMLKRLLCILLACVMTLGAHIPAFAEETAPAWNFSVTYVEADSSFTQGVASTGWMEQMTIADPQSAAEDFLGWGSLPNSEVQYEPDGKITLMSQNRHAILYAIYGSADDNLFEIVYHVGEHTRRELFRSAEAEYAATLAGAYSDGFTGWALTKGAEKADYQPGDTVSLTPSLRATDATQTNKPSLELYAVLTGNASYVFTLCYHYGSGTTPVEYKSESVVQYFTLSGDKGVTGWSMFPGGAVSFAPGAEVCLQYNSPEIHLYAVGGTDPATAQAFAAHEPEQEQEQEPEPEQEPALPTSNWSWSSSNESVATVDPLTGEVTAVAPGTAIIRAADTVTTTDLNTGDVHTQLLTATITVTVLGPCDLCGAQDVAHKVMDCGNHCEAQLTELTHQIAACGFTGGEYYSKNVLQTYAPHYDCDGEEHSAELISEYCAFEPGHQHTSCWPTQWHYCDAEKGGCGNYHTCESSVNHRPCSCGSGLICHPAHRSPCGVAEHRPCVNEGFSWAEHVWCDKCDGYICSSNHGTEKGQCSYVPPVICSYCGAEGVQHSAAACGKHCTAQSGTHSKCETDGEGCGGWLCEGSHDRLTCEHCQQAGGTHQECSHCGDWLCYTPNVSHGTGEGQCGYVVPMCSFCKQEGEQHSTVDCGSHCTNQSGDHSQCGVCDTYYCNGWNHHGDCDHCYSSSLASDHAFCTVCDDGFLCWGDHGEGICDAQ